MNILEKTNFIGQVFTGGVKAQLSQEWTWGAAVVVGLQQGLKYKGNFKNGLAGGLAVLMVISTANGFYNIVLNRAKIMEILKEGD